MITNDTSRRRLIPFATYSGETRPEEMFRRSMEPLRRKCVIHCATVFSIGIPVPVSNFDGVTLFPRIGFERSDAIAEAKRGRGEEGIDRPVPKGVLP